jgi:hypothetical protein
MNLKHLWVQLNSWVIHRCILCHELRKQKAKVNGDYYDNKYLKSLLKTPNISNELQECIDLALDLNCIVAEGNFELENWLNIGIGRVKVPKVLIIFSHAKPVLVHCALIDAKRAILVLKTVWRNFQCYITFLHIVQCIKVVQWLSLFNWLGEVSHVHKLVDERNVHKVVLVKRDLV